MIHKRLLAILLTLTMIAGSLPAVVLADENADVMTEETTEDAADGDAAEEEGSTVSDGISEETDEGYSYVENVTEETALVEEPVRNGNEEGDSIPDGVIPVSDASDFGPLDSEGRYILNSDATYELQNDISTEGRIVIGNGSTDVNVTIDLKGHTIDRGLTYPVDNPVAGGGVFGILGYGNLTVINGTVQGGYRAGGNGGGFNVDAHATLILEDVTVKNNIAGHAGGGIYANGYKAHVILKGASKVTGNMAGTYGGGIYVSTTNSSVTLEGTSTVTGNTAGTNGNGIYVCDHGFLNIKDEPRVTGNGSSENVYLAAGERIKVVGSLGPDTRIGVTRQNDGMTSVTLGYYNYTHTGDPEEMFICESGDMFTVVDKDESRNDEVWFAFEYVTRSWDNDSGKVVEETKIVHKYTRFDDVSLSDDETVDLINNNWYVVSNDVNLQHVVRCFTGANIVLFDGAILTCSKGIVVEGGNTLNIYGQSEDSGKLIATGYDDSAGIGGGAKTSTGTINIHGGIIESTGDEYGAGIGGGDETTCGVVTIYGGSVTATGGGYAPGIGCGQKSSDLGTVKIYGGRITATGGDNAPGIGGSGEAWSNGDLSSGVIEIAGGTVISTGTDRAAGIGGGYGSDIKIDITISGGNVVATAGGIGAAGIGAGSYNKTHGGDFTGNIVISGGKVVATGRGDSVNSVAGAGIGSGYSGYMTGNITISGGTVEANAESGATAIGAGTRHGCEGGTISITGGSVTMTITVHHDLFCPHIGHGNFAFDDDDGTLEIGDGLCVYYDNSDSVAASDRVSTCQEVINKNTVSTLHIGPCSHPNNHRYTSIDDIKHKYQCEYCASVITEDHSYGDGSVCSLCGHYGKGEVRLAGYSLSLEGDIAVNYHMEFTGEIAQSNTAHMHFELPDGTSDDMYMSQAEIKELDGHTYHVFKCRIAAKYINSEIRAYMVNGSMTGKEYTFTVKDYADYLIENTGDETLIDRQAKELARALVNYGAFVQDYFGITSSLEPDPEAVRNVAVDDKFKYDRTDTVLPDNVSFIGSTLTVQSKINMSVYLDTDQVIHVIDCVDQNGYIYPCAPREVDGHIALTVYNLTVTELDIPLTIRFTVGSDDTEYHIGYCPLTYCYNVINRNYDDDLTNVCRALYKYWDEAELYQLYCREAGSGDN